MPELVRPRGHRAIGVVYRPEYERFGNYVPLILTIVRCNCRRHRA
jgi:hypothetical protein